VVLAEVPRRSQLGSARAGLGRSSQLDHDSKRGAFVTATWRLLGALLFPLWVPWLSAQEETSVATAKFDTAKFDTAEVDTAMVDPGMELRQLHALLDEAKPGENAFEYSADSFVNYVQGDSILLRGHAVVLSRGTRLEAGEMVYHRRRDVIVARALVDSSGNLEGEPTLSRGKDVLRGEIIVYDVVSGEGTIAAGKISYKDGFYGGRHIQTLSDQQFHIHAGSYTTCDLTHPHFDFYSPRIKVLAGDMAIARPVYLRIGERRLFWIPFYVFSLREDRQSGLLTPGFGRRPVRFASRESEWEVSNLGYYLAPSDYWDLTLGANLRQRSGWLARLALSYARRYHYRGSVETRLENRQSGNTNSSQWWTTVRHDQELGDSASLRFSGTFQSDSDFIRDNSVDLQERLSRTLRSNLRFNKRWREAGYSFSLNASQVKNLDIESFNEVLPEVSLRSNRKSLFGAAGRGTTGPWYSRIYYDVNGRLRNTRKGTPADTTSLTSADAGVKLSSQQRPLSWLNLNASLDERWRDRDLRSGSSSFRGVRTERANASLSLSQTVYGMFFPRHFGPVTALRHVVKPDVALRYQATRTDTGGVLGFGGGSSPWRQSRQITFRLSNTFWVKVLRDEEEKKVRLTQLNLSSSYDFDRKGRPLSDLVSSLTVEAGRRLNTRLSVRSEFYDDDDNFRHGFPRLRQLEINTTARVFVASTRGRGNSSRRRDGDDRLSGPTSAGRYSTGGASASSGYAGASRFGSEFGYENGLQRDIDRQGSSRSLQVSHYYSRRRSTFSSTVIRSWIRTGAGWSWRRAWNMNYSINYNLKAKGVALLSSARVTAELLSIQREFHDWTATVNLEPSRFSRDHAFYFKAQFKDIPQIRFERGDSRRL
jgi:hypothetical protein